jgi:hypothetical protein
MTSKMSLRKSNSRLSRLSNKKIIKNNPLSKITPHKHALPPCQQQNRKIRLYRPIIQNKIQPTLPRKLSLPGRTLSRRLGNSSSQGEAARE